MEVDISDVPQESVSELTLFNLFVGDMDSRINCTFSKFTDDTKLHIVVNILEGKCAIQRNLNRLKRWALEL